MCSTKIVNFFGGPGCGKSTAALGVTFYLKKKYFANVEYVSEYAKLITWEGHKNILQDQFFTTANQNRSLQRLLGKVDLAITDSPLLLGINYKSLDSLFDSYTKFVLDQFNFYDNINYLLVRDPKKPYLCKGRSQTEEEAKQIDLKIEDILIDNNICYEKVFVDENTERKIAENLTILLDQKWQNKNIR